MAEPAPHEAEDPPVLHGPIDLEDSKAVTEFINSILSRVDGVALNPTESEVVADLFSACFDVSRLLALCARPAVISSCLCCAFDHVQAID